MDPATHPAGPGRRRRGVHGARRREGRGDAADGDGDPRPRGGRPRRRRRDARRGLARTSAAARSLARSMPGRRGSSFMPAGARLRGGAGCASSRARRRRRGARARVAISRRPGRRRRRRMALERAFERLDADAPNDAGPPSPRRAGLAEIAAVLGIPVGTAEVALLPLARRSSERWSGGTMTPFDDDEIRACSTREPGIDGVEALDLLQLQAIPGIRAASWRAPPEPSGR